MAAPVAKGQRGNARLWIGLALSLVLIGLAVTSLLWTPFPIAGTDLTQGLLDPGAPHWLGTDPAGRDMASLLMSATLTSLVIAVLAVAVGLLIGVPLGLIAAISGGSIDWLIQKFSDFLVVFPALVIAILCSALAGPGALNAVIAVGTINIPVLARVARAGAADVKALDYVAAARLAGLGGWAIAWRHLLPNAWGPVMMQAIRLLALGLIGEAGLSYLGLGARSPQVSLGLMLSEAQGNFLAHPWLALLPGLVIVLLVLALNLLADGLADTFRPRPRRERAARAAA